MRKALGMCLAMFKVNCQLLQQGTTFMQHSSGKTEEKFIRMSDDYTFLEIKKT